MNNNIKASAMDSVTELAPKLKRSRSTFNLMLKDYTSFNVGELVPIGNFTEVLPGDTFNVNLDLFLRMTSPSKRPPMDNLHMDVYAFFVPYRFLDDSWQEIQGENPKAWVAPAKSCSSLVFGDGVGVSINAHSLLCHLGLPAGFTVDNSDPATKVNIYPIYSYFKIVNDWFRDENLQDELAFDTTNNDYDLSDLPTINNNLVSYAGSLFRVAKYHDVFTSALPAPQKSANPVTIPSILKESAPVGFVSPSNVTTSSVLNAAQLPSGSVLVANKFIQAQGNLAGDPKTIADLSQAFTPGTINELRLAFQLQKAYELDARSGTRYTEALEARFGTKNPDLRLGRSELLGHYRFPINMSEVQSDGGILNTDDDTLRGESGGGYSAAVGAGASKTGSSKHICVKTFLEHGIFMILGCVRPDLTYQTGVAKFWRKLDRFSFYEPVFSNIGEVAIMKSELYGDQLPSDSVFGYQEAWYEYRYKTNNISGCLASNSNEGFDVFHYAVDFNAAPTLSSAFIEQSPTAIDRTLLFSSQVVDQFILNAQGVIKATRVMPLYSIPGLVDHF